MTQPNTPEANKSLEDFVPDEAIDEPLGIGDLSVARPWQGTNKVCRPPEYDGVEPRLESAPHLRDCLADDIAAVLNVGRRVRDAGADHGPTENQHDRARAARCHINGRGRR